MIYKLALLVSLCLPAFAQTSFWSVLTLPGTPTTSDTGAVNLGLKFRSDVAGTITGLRFYKGSGNRGTHVGNLWSSSGFRLASVTFVNETASGWQSATFAAPVAIAAATTYTISYLAPVGRYADDQYFGWGALSAAPLHVVGSSPGVYVYSSSARFPSSAWNASNYWVDPVFVAGPPPPPPPTYSLSGNVTGSAATVTMSGSATGVTNTDAAGNYIFSGLVNGTDVLSASAPNFSFTPTSVSEIINNASIAGINFAGTPGPTQHYVDLTWTASTSPNVVGYNVYRSSTSGGPYGKVNGAFIASTGYTDASVSNSQTYYYVATAVDNNSIESAYSVPATAVIPN